MLFPLRKVAPSVDSGTRYLKASHSGRNRPPQSRKWTPIETERCLSGTTTLHKCGSGHASRSVVRSTAADGKSPQPSSRTITAHHDVEEEEPLILQNCHHFINLTNGIEALPVLQELQLPYSFVRIQSTACEQQHLEALVAELDANLLLHLALGHSCLVYDCGSRGRDGTPRALWYGLEFVRYTLSKLWLRRPCPALLRGRNVARTFDDHIRAFRQSTTRRLQYYAKYLPRAGAEAGAGAGAVNSGAADGRLPAGPSGDGTGSAPAAATTAAITSLTQIRLYGVCRTTDHDEDVDFYVRMLHSHELPAGAAAAAAVAAGIAATSCSRPERQREGIGESDVALPRSSQPGRTRQQAAPARPLVEDGEAVLARYGFRLFRRGLSQVEWAAAKANSAKARMPNAAEAGTAAATAAAAAMAVAASEGQLSSSAVAATAVGGEAAEAAAAPAEPTTLLSAPLP